MVDAEAIAAVAVPGIFAPIRIAMPPQIPEADRLHAVHEVRRRVDGPGLVDIGATCVEVPDRQRRVIDPRGEHGNQRPPVRHLPQQVGHVNAGEPYHAEIDIDQAIRLRYIQTECTLRGEAAPRGDQHAGALGRWHELGDMPIPRGPQRSAQPVRRVAAAVFRQDQHVGIVAHQGSHDAGQPRPAALADIPGKQAHGSDVRRSRSRSGSLRPSA
jgi:hypothetical protein